MSRAVSIEPVNATPASRASGSTAPAIVGPSPGRNCSARCGRPASNSSATTRAADERRLLGRLGKDRVAGRERRGDLPRKNRDREIPRTDADEYAAALEPQCIALARRAGQQHRRRERAARFVRVVPQKVDGLADLGERVSNPARPLRRRTAQRVRRDGLRCGRPPRAGARRGAPPRSRSTPGRRHRPTQARVSPLRHRQRRLRRRSARGRPGHVSSALRRSARLPSTSGAARAGRCAAAASASPSGASSAGSAVLSPAELRRASP